MKRKYAENEHENGNIRKKRKGEGLKQGKKNIEWLKGTLCPTESKGAWFIKPFEELPRGYNKFKDVFMYPKYISEYVLTVKAGDKLEFLLGDRDKTRPFAYKVRIFRYSSRTCEELTEYIMKLSKDLETKKEALMKVLPCTAMWSFLGSPEFKFVTGLYLA